MAILTLFYVPMEPDKGIARLIVIEEVQVPVHEIEGLSLVIGMAENALVLVSVIPTPLSNTRSQLLVTSEAFVIGHTFSG